MTEGFRGGASAAIADAAASRRSVRLCPMRRRIPATVATGARYPRLMEWAEDFSYAYFDRLLDAAAAAFSIRRVMDGPDALGGATRTLLLRHDVDLDLAAAVRMGEIESRRGSASTYMVMTTSPLYRLEDPGSRARLRELQAMGHEIALHFDFPDPAMRATPPSPAAVAPLVDAAAGRIEQLIAAPVRSVSFHRPLPEFLRGPLRIAGRVNAYARELMERYISDSAGRWREGEPLPMLAEPTTNLMQLLTHPIWWDDRHEGAQRRLQLFFERSTAGLSAEQTARFSDDLANHILVRRTEVASDRARSL